MFLQIYTFFVKNNVFTNFPLFKKKNPFFDIYPIFYFLTFLDTFFFFEIFHLFHFFILFIFTFSMFLTISLLFTF